MKLKIAKEEDRLTVAAILVKNGYKVSQTRKKKDSSKAYVYFLEIEDGTEKVEK